MFMIHTWKEVTSQWAFFVHLHKTDHQALTALGDAARWFLLEYKTTNISK